MTLATNAVASTPTPSRAARQGLDTLDNLTSALGALRDLLIPSRDMNDVSRDDLAGLFTLLMFEEREPGDRGARARSAVFAVADLISPRPTSAPSRAIACAPWSICWPTCTPKLWRRCDPPWPGMNSERPRGIAVPAD